jgi:hypothetical protein
VIPDLNVTALRNCSLLASVFELVGELEVDRPVHKHVGKYSDIQIQVAREPCGLGNGNSNAILAGITF